MSKKSVFRRWTSVAMLAGIALAAQPPTQVTPAPVAFKMTSTNGQDAFASEQPMDPQAARGGRGPEHCALSVGIFLGGALGFFANPFLGTAVMRLGFMAAALHCVSE